MNFRIPSIEDANYSDSWKQYISSGQRFIELFGKTKNGKEVNLNCLLISRGEAGLLILETIYGGKKYEEK